MVFRSEVPLLRVFEERVVVHLASFSYDTGYFLPLCVEVLSKTSLDATNYPITCVACLAKAEDGDLDITDDMRQGWQYVSYAISTCSRSF